MPWLFFPLNQSGYKALLDQNGTTATSCSASPWPSVLQLALTPLSLGKNARGGAAIWGSEHFSVMDWDVQLICCFYKSLFIQSWSVHWIVQDGVLLLALQTCYFHWKMHAGVTGALQWAVHCYCTLQNNFIVVFQHVSSGGPCCIPVNAEFCTWSKCWIEKSIPPWAFLISKH